MESLSLTSQRPTAPLDMTLQNMEQKSNPGFQATCSTVTPDVVERRTSRNGAGGVCNKAHGVQRKRRTGHASSESNSHTIGLGRGCHYIQYTFQTVTPLVYWFQEFSVSAGVSHNNNDKDTDKENNRYDYTRPLPQKCDLTLHTRVRQNSLPAAPLKAEQPKTAVKDLLGLTCAAKPLMSYMSAQGQSSFTTQTARVRSSALTATCDGVDPVNTWDRKAKSVTVVLATFNTP